MPSLHELQAGFFDAVFADNPGFSEHILNVGGLHGEQRLGIYRNNTLANFTDALRITYPVVCRLVGEDFFGYAAKQYIAQNPSTSGDLQEYGATFPEFLKNFEPAAGLPYLPDVADLELAQEQVFYAADSGFLDTVALARVPQERYGELKFALSSASRLVTSRFPILRIWQVNQDDYCEEQTVNLDAGKDNLLVIRQRNLDVEIQSLAVGELALLQALQEQQDFASACEQALTVQPDFDVPTVFRWHVAQGTLTGFTL